MHLDVRFEEQWKTLTENVVKKLGKIDVMLNAASITGIQDDFGPQDLEHISLDEWNMVHAVNVNGVFLGCKYAIKVMREQKKFLQQSSF